MPIDIPTNDLLALLYAKDYRIVITTNNDSQFVSFYHPLALESLYIPHSYSMEFTHEQIRNDLALNLLHWTKLKVTYALEY